MGIGGSIAIFFVIWWIGLFAVLPWGIRSQWETGDVVEGSDPGAPAQPRLLKIVLANTVFAACVFAAFYFVYTSHLLTLDMVPFLPFGPDSR